MITHQWNDHTNSSNILDKFEDMLEKTLANQKDLMLAIKEQKERRLLIGDPDKIKAALARFNQQPKLKL